MESVCDLREVVLSAGVGVCLVINSLGNTHTRQELGSANASAWSAFVRACWTAGRLRTFRTSQLFLHVRSRTSSTNVTYSVTALMSSLLH